MKICLIGPCSPADLSDNLSNFDQKQYENVSFYRGIPVSTLAIELLEHGHEVEVVTSAFGLETDSIVLLGPNLRMTIICSISSAKKRALTLFWRDRRRIAIVLKKIEADVYHAHWTYEFALAAIIAKRKGLLITAHDAPLKIFFHYRDPYRFLRLVLAILVRLRAPNMAAVSPYLAQNWRRQMFWRKKISVLPNITPREKCNELKQGSREKDIVLCISDSSKLKNVKTLIEAWQLVHHNFPLAKLRLIGYGLGEGDTYQKWALENNLADGIEWIGYVNRSKIFYELNVATILCHPSLEESHSLVLIESMASGIPIIGGENSGAVPWTLGNAGLLVDVTSKEQISNAISKLLLNEKLRETMSRVAMERSKTVFSASKILPLYLQTYLEILAKN